MKTKILIFFALLSLIFISNKSFSQDDYSVLPQEGRNTLFYNNLLKEFDSIMVNRKKAIEKALTSKETIIAYQKQLKERYLSILGEFPEKTSLNATIVGTVTSTSGYKIEKIYYQSRPNHHVTANFYIPDGTGPFPAVIILCGHYPVAKTYVDYQNLSILFAKNGIAALIVDPVCQGERYQIHDSEGKLSFLGSSGTSAQTRLETGAVLNNYSIVAHQLWDNHRSVDYLYSRTDVVDTSKIGCTGHSGGGAQASYLLAYDARLKVGTVANYITNETSMLKDLKEPQTASQNLAFEGAMGIDQPDYVTLFAPKPYMMIITTDNADGLFKIDAARETRDEAQKFYDTLGAAEKIKLFETSDAHDYTKIKREEAVRWFKRWLTGNNDTVIETNQTTLPADSLIVTSTGQVFSHFTGEMAIQDISYNKALKDSVLRKQFWLNNSKDSCIKKVKELILLDENYEAPTSENTGSIDRGTYTISKLKITSGNDFPVPALLFKPKNISGKKGAVIYVDGRGKSFDADDDGVIETVYLNNDKIVLSIDVSGIGETKDYGSDGKYGSDDQRLTVIAAYNGHTLIGLRVEDVLKSADYLLTDSNVDENNIDIVGIEKCAPVALHAAAIDNRIKNVTLQKAYKSWLDLVYNPSIEQVMSYAVHGALEYYDFPDLIEAISPNTVNFTKVADARLKNITVDGGTLSPKFASNIYEYEITDLKKNEITIYSVASDENATITGTGTYNADTIEKKIEIKVIAEDGVNSNTYEITIPAITTISLNKYINYKESLYQNFPNPFINSTTISYNLKNASFVSLKIIDETGKEINTLVNKFQHAGNYSVNFNAENLNPGIYFYNLQSAGINETKKMIKVLD